MDIKITITGTLIDHDKAELAQKLEALVTDFIGEYINPIAELGNDGEPITWYQVDVK